MTLRKCTTSFDKKMKMKVSSKVSQKNKGLGAFVFKHFDAISWVFTIIMIVSMAVSLFYGVLGLYNWIYFGNCNGPDSTVVCELNSLTGLNKNGGTSLVPGLDSNICITSPDVNNLGVGQKT